MALPKQVEQQMKEIEEMERALTAQSEGDATPEPVAETQPVQEQPTEPVEQAPVAEAKPVEPTEDWAQKYRSLKGHFDAEVPRLHQQNKELLTQLQTMQAQIADLQKPKQQAVDERLVSDEEEERYGADLIDVQRRVAKEVMRDMVKPLQDDLAKRDAKIAQLEAQLGKTSGDVTTLTFEQQLEKAIPNFAQLNTDPKWIAWLDEVDPYTQEPRRSYAEYVYGNGDVVKLKQIVGFYETSTNQQPQDQQRQQRQTELQRQVAPSRTATASTAPQGERFYTEAENNRMWNKVKELYSKGQNDEAAKIESELSQAMMQGRIRG